VVRVSCSSHPVVSRFGAVQLALRRSVAREVLTRPRLIEIIRLAHGKPSDDRCTRRRSPRSTAGCREPHEGNRGSMASVAGAAGRVHFDLQTALGMRSDRCNRPACFCLFALPALTFFGGAVVGRVFGLHRLLRGTMAAVALGGMAATGCRKMLREPEPRIVRVRHRAVRAARRRLAQKRSALRKV
jgi:hypothetical protein